MPDNKIQLPTGFKLDNDIKLPSGFTLDSDVVKKKVGGEGFSLSKSQLASPDFSKGEKIAKMGFAIPQSEIGTAIQKDKKIEGNTTAGLYNTLVGSLASFAGGSAYIADVASIPMPGMPLNVRVANAERSRKQVEDFINKARSSASSPEFEKQQSQFDITNGVDLQDVKGLAFQAPKTLLDMGMGVLSAGASFFPQAINDAQKDLEESGNADKLSPTQKVGYLTIQGSIQMALEKIGLDKVLGKTGLTKKVGQKLAGEVVEEFVKKGVKATAKDIENEVIKKATKLVTKIKNVGAKAATSFAVEGGTEGLQQAGSDAIKTITNKIADNEIFNQEDINNNFWKNILNSGVAGGVIGGGLGGGLGALNNTNKAIRSQIAAVQSPEDLANLQTQISQQVEMGNITPQEAEAANIKAEEYAEIASKIPTQVSSEDKYKIIGGIEQRNQLKDAIQKSMDEMTNIDESFKPQKQDEIDLLQSKLNQVNDYVDGIVGGKEFDYKEKKGQFYKIDSQGTESAITKQDYDIAKAVQEENKRKQTQQESIEEPTKEQIQEDIKNNRLATFTYKSEQEVPEVFKDRISSTGENTLPDGTVESFIRVTVPKSLADYQLAKTKPTEIVKPTEVEVTEEVKTVKLDELPDRAFAVGMTVEKFEDLKSKIQKEGFTQPIIIDKESGNVLDGQSRLLAAQDLGIKDVPSIYMDNPTKADLNEKIKELEKQYIPSQEFKPTEVKEAPKQEKKLGKSLISEEPIQGRGVVIATETGLTEQERLDKIAEREKQTKISDKVNTENALVQETKLFYEKNKRQRSTSEGLRKLNELRIKARELGLEIDDASESVVRKKGSRKTKIKYNSKADADSIIDKTGKTIYERRKDVQDVFKILNDNKNFLDFKTDLGVRMSDAQLDATIQDILDGVPSKRANRYLDEVQKAIDNDAFGLKDMGNNALTLEQIIESDRDINKIEKEFVGQLMDEKALEDWLNDQYNLTPEEEAIMIDDFENLLNEYEYENETRPEGEVSTVKPATEERVVTKAEPTEINKKTTSIESKKEVTLQDIYEALPKSERLKNEQVKEIVDKNFDSIMKQLEKYKIC